MSHYRAFTYAIPGINSISSGACNVPPPINKKCVT